MPINANTIFVHKFLNYYFLHEDSVLKTSWNTDLVLNSDKATFKLG